MSNPAYWGFIVLLPLVAAFMPMTGPGNSLRPLPAIRSLNVPLSSGLRLLLSPISTELRGHTPTIPAVRGNCATCGSAGRLNKQKLTTMRQWVGTGIFLHGQGTVGIAVNSVLALLGIVTGKYKSALTLEGLLHAWILGVILWRSLGFAGWSTCTFYLVVGSIATKIRKKEKEALGIAEARGGQRGPENVWGSALTAAVCAILATFSPWDSLTFKLGFVASLATKLSDTVASEIGKAFGKTTYLITTFQRVPAGTEGAVSLEGTLAGVAASIVMALYGLVAGLITPIGGLLCIVAAFVATTAESAIGATIQGKYAFLTNEVVNFINTAIGALVAMGGLTLLGQ